MSPPRGRIETNLVDELASLPLMQQPDSRQLFMRRLRQQLDHHVELRDFPAPRAQCVEIVDCCLPLPPTLWVVVEVVEYFEPAARQLRRLRRLLHEREVIDVLHEEDWSELWEPLQAINPEDPGRLYQRATEHQLAAPPPWCEHAWDMFVHLSGQNAPASGLPPGMVFLLLLEQEVDSATAGLLRRRNQRMATMLEVTELIDRRRAVMNTGTDQPLERHVYLVIQVEPEHEPANGSPPERYVVSQYRQWYGDDSWHSQLHSRIQGVSGADLERAVERVVGQMEEDWTDRRGEVVIEFVLPVELLNADVAWWRKERARPDLNLPEKVLAMDYPVVVRSLDRLREPRWHHAWRRRWGLLQEEPALSRLYRSQPGGTDFTPMEAAIASDWRLAALLLSQPPTMDESGVGEIMTALRAGLPVIIWHRAQLATEALREEAHEMTTGGQISRLPTHVRNARLAALQVAEHERGGHLGRHLAVLWDDPNRMPELGSGSSTRDGS